MASGTSSAAGFLPERRTLASLRESAQACRGCGLHERATQAVFGEGRTRAEAMLVGEAPGDYEDRSGRPFVGPAGKLLRQALVDAGLDRPSVYLTNAVKHFKWQARGTRRIHQAPSRSEVVACRPWLEAELAAVRPRALVLLGATAAQSLLGSSFRVSQMRARPVASELAELVIATVHPSSILRAPRGEARRAAFDAFVADLRVVGSYLS